MNKFVTVNVTVGNYSNQYEVEERRKEQRTMGEATLEQVSDDALRENFTSDTYLPYKLGPSLEDCLNELLLQDLFEKMNAPPAVQELGGVTFFPYSTSRECHSLRDNEEEQEEKRTRRVSIAPSSEADECASAKESEATAASGLIGKIISVDNWSHHPAGAIPNPRSNNISCYRAGKVLLFVKLLESEKTITLAHLTPDDTITKVKAALFRQEGIPPYRQRLILSGKRLKDNKTLLDYRIRYMATLHLSVR